MLRSIIILLVTCALLTTTGCRSLVGVGGDQTGEQTINSKPPIIVNVPEQTDPIKLKNDITSTLDDRIKLESRNTQNQMSGALNVAEARLAEKITGVEANVRTELKTEINSRIENTANIKGQLAENANVTTKLQAELNNQIALNADLKVKFEAQANIINDMKLEIKGLTFTANALVGINNKLEQRFENLSAGRDINYLPKEVVEIMVDRERSNAKTMAAIFGVLLVALGWLGRLSRQREHNRTLEEREERRMMFDLLMDVLAMLSPTDGAKFQERVAKIKSRHYGNLPNPQEFKDPDNKPSTSWWNFWRKS